MDHKYYCLSVILKTRGKKSTWRVLWTVDGTRSSSYRLQKAALLTNQSSEVTVRTCFSYQQTTGFVDVVRVPCRLDELCKPRRKQDCPFVTKKTVPTQQWLFCHCICIPRKCARLYQSLFLTKQKQKRKRCFLALMTTPNLFTAINAQSHIQYYQLMMKMTTMPLLQFVFPP